MNGILDPQGRHKKLKRQLKAKERTIQRLKNRIVWLEVQLTLQKEGEYTEEGNQSGACILDDDGKNCAKCLELRNRLEASFQLPMVHELTKIEDRQHHPLYTAPVTSDPESIGSSNRQEFMLNIDTSPYSVTDRREDEAFTVFNEMEEGRNNREVSGNAFCLVVVAVAIMLIHWM